MTTLLLSCDQILYHYKGKYYTTDVWQEFFNRYLRVYDRLRLAIRCKEKTEFDRSWKELNPDKVEIVNIPCFSGPKEYLKEYFTIGNAIRNVTEGCDAAIIRLPSTIGQRVAHKVMRSGIPYAVEIVYDAGDGASNSSSFIERLLWKRIDKDMKNISESADGVSYVTEKYLQKHYSSKKKNAFFSHYSTLSLPKNFYTSARKFPQKNTLSIVHVSNQVDCRTRKGHIQLIEILSILKLQGKRISLSFVGADYHNGIRQLKEMAKNAGVLDQINFLGQVNREQLSKILDNHDLFVFPTAAEGLPRVIIEAMSKGLPCVISDVSGNPELVSEDMLANYLDVKSFAEKVALLMEDKSLYESKSKQNFEKSLSFESSMLQKKRDDFYQKLKDRINPDSKKK